MYYTTGRIYFVKEETTLPFNFLSNQETIQERKMYQFFIGIDIGSSFHVASCIHFQAFLDPKGQEWKRSKTMKFNADSAGITSILNAFKQVERQFGVQRDDFFILLEPTGGHYSFLIQQVLLYEGYTLFQVENKAVKNFRESHLGITEKSDAMDAKVMSYMGWHKTLHPHMHGVRLIKPASVSQSIFRTIMRDRWFLNTQLTRRKNQIQQLLQVTHPDLKAAFKKPSSPSVLRFILRYPTGIDLQGATQDELRQAMIEAGANSVATKASRILYEHSLYTVAIPVPHLIGRQKWMIEEALRIEQSIKDLDKHIQGLLHGNVQQGISPHPYTKLLYSFPFMSDNWACTLIGTIGDVDRFNTYKEFKKYMGVSAENKQSGTSVKGTRQTFSGVRDTRRVLFQMALIMIATKKQPTVFSMYYNRLVEREMNKKKAIVHLCGKIAKLIYTTLKTGQEYDSKKHAQACGIAWESKYDKKLEKIDDEAFHDEALRFIGETPPTELEELDV